MGIAYEILNSFTGAIQFVAQIECDDDAPRSAKVGLAVKWAVENKADLSEADLSKANLSWADLSKADLRAIKHDIWGIMLNAIPEVPALRQAIVDGKVDGSTYSGPCACLCGTIANVRHCSPYTMTGIQTNSDSPAERFFLAIRPGDTPEKSQPAKLVLEWVDEFLALVKLAIPLTEAA